MNKLFSDLKTDEEKSNFFLSGRGYETGVIAPAIQNDVAMAYHRCAEYKKEVQALRDEALREVYERQEPIVSQAMRDMMNTTLEEAANHIESLGSGHHVDVYAESIRALKEQS